MKILLRFSTRSEMWMMRCGSILLYDLCFSFSYSLYLIISPACPGCQFSSAQYVFECSLESAVYCKQ